MTLYKSSAVALTLALALSTNRGAAAEPQPLKIGVQLPMTGERSSVGRLMLNGLQMALDTLSPKLELVLADDESTPDGAVKALDKLIHDPQIIAIAGEINSPFVMASAPIVDKAGLPYLTAGSSPKTTLQSPWIFRVGASDAVLADFLARYIVDELKIKSIAIMHDKTGIHNQRADLMATVLKDTAGVVPVANVTWSSGDRQFKTQFEQVIASHPQAIPALAETPEGGSFFRQAKASGVQVQIIAQRDFGVRRVFEEAGDAAGGRADLHRVRPGSSGRRH